MAISIIRLPVTCPVCGSTVVTGFNAAEMVDAVVNSTPLRLYAGCHKFPWYANDWEVQEIRQYLYQAWLGGNRDKEVDPKGKY